MALASHLQLLFRPPPTFFSLFHRVKAIPLHTIHHSRQLSSPFSLHVSSSLPSQPTDSGGEGPEVEDEPSRQLSSPFSLHASSSLPSQPTDYGGGGLEVEDEPVLGVSESELRFSSPVTSGMTGVPELTVKEKKDLASYAHGLGDKLKSQQVGKSGVTDNVVFAFNETLEANELLKLKIHRSCPGELGDVVKELEQRTRSVAVGQIGRVVIFYRPSITKMKAEEKRKEARKVFAQRKLKWRASIQGRESRPGHSRTSRFVSSTRSYSQQ